MGYIHRPIRHGAIKSPCRSGALRFIFLWVGMQIHWRIYPPRARSSCMHLFSLRDRSYMFLIVTVQIHGDVYDKILEPKLAGILKHEIA